MGIREIYSAPSLLGFGKVLIEVQPNLTSLFRLVRQLSTLIKGSGRIAPGAG